MSMALTDIRAFARSATALDTNDLPDAMLDVMIRDIHYKWTNASRVWSFLAVEFPLFTTVSGTQSYSYGDPMLTDTASGQPMRSVTSVTGPHWQVRPIPHEMARKRFPKVWLYKGEPAFWSDYGNTLWFWPLPNSAYTMTVVGYRQPKNIVAAGDMPDLPAEFHEPMAMAVVSAAFAQQEDFEGAKWYADLAGDRFVVLKDQYTDTDSGVPTVLNGGGDVYQEFMLPSRLRYSWER